MCRVQFLYSNMEKDLTLWTIFSYSLYSLLPLSQTRGDNLIFSLLQLFSSHSILMLLVQSMSIYQIC